MGVWLDKQGNGFISRNPQGSCWCKSNHSHHPLTAFLHIRLTLLGVRRILIYMKTCCKCGEEKDLSFFCKDSKSKDKKQSMCKKCKSASVIAYYKSHPEKRREKERKRGLKRYYQNRVHYNISRLVRAGLVGHVKSKPTFDLLGYTVEELKVHLEKRFSPGMSWENYGRWHIDHIVPRASLDYDSSDHPNFKRCWSIDNLQPLWAEDNLKKGASTTFSETRQ